MAVSYKPEGYGAVTPFFLVDDVAKFIDFLVGAFSAVEHSRSTAPDGTVMHADISIGDSHIMTGQAQGEWKSMPAMMYLYVEDCDAVYKQAIAAGATSLREPKDEFYGDRSAAVYDEFGNQWWIATHFEDVSEEEMERRMKEQMG